MRHEQSAPQYAARRVLVWRFSRASTRSYRAVLPAALAFFHRALASAESLARAAALMVLFVDRLAPLILAHLALAAAAILARTAGLLLFFFWGALPAPSWAAEPRARTSSAWRESIRSFMSAALLSCCEDRVISDEFIDPSLNRLQELSSSLACRTAVLAHPEKRLDRHTRQSYRVNYEILRIGVGPAVPCCLHVVGAGGLCRFGAVPTDTTSVNCAEYTNCLGQGGGGKIPG